MIEELELVKLLFSLTISIDSEGNFMFKNDKGETLFYLIKNFRLYVDLDIWGRLPDYIKTRDTIAKIFTKHLGITELPDVEKVKQYWN